MIKTRGEKSKGLARRCLWSVWVSCYERAAEYYEAAARQGLAGAQYNLGLLYANGQGVEQSNETARELWMKSAEQGFENAIKALQRLDEIEGRTTPSFIPKPIECANCYRPHDPLENKLRPCAKCHQAFYCGRECQVKHWKAEWNGHKQSCNKILISIAPPPPPFTRGNEDQIGLHTDQKCNEGHGLVRFNTPHNGYYCDLCRQGVPKDAVMYGCEKCSYDICTSCESN